MLTGNDDNLNDDIDLFRQAVAGTNRNHRKYREDRHLPQETVPRPAVKIRKAQLVESPSLSCVIIDQTSHGDTVLFVRDGFQKKSIRKLKRGEYCIGATLDLHGRTAIQSEHNLAQFVNDTISAGISTALIIHGKGLHSTISDSMESGGVLKRVTVNWLKQQPRVRAFCSTVASDGGTGAVYVRFDLKTVSNHSN